MRWVLIAVGLIAGVLSVLVIQHSLGQSASAGKPPPLDESKVKGSESSGSAEKSSKSKPGTERAGDEAAIRANIAKFVKAFNAQDAKAVAALFTSDGQIMDKDGNTSNGRAAIEKTFKELFEAAPQKEIEVFVESIRFIGSDLAVEVGTTKETPQPGEAPDNDRYTVLHVKRDGKWLMAFARDEEGDPPTNHEQLQALSWLVGDWVDDGGNSVVRSSCRWSDDGNFLLQDFKLELNGKNAMNVSQRIGWDPLAKSVHSWVFDSEGGYGESVWSRDGDSWIIKATGVRPDGKTASATNVFVPAGKDAYVWRTTDRIVGGELQPSLEVKVIRQPPQPSK
jgi:uncharacterized protein (TIGR02246 family)